MCKNHRKSFKHPQKCVDHDIYILAFFSYHENNEKNKENDEVEKEGKESIGEN
jgi:hypothetical protein